MRYLLNLLALLGFAALLSGCEDDVTTTTINSPELGTLQISLTDAPAGFDAVYITFSEVSAHIDGQWMTVRGEPMTVNLLEWNNGKSIIIGTADLPAGHYTQIRLKIDSAEVVVNGQAEPAMVPSGAQTGLKLVHQFTLNAGSTYELVIDFDANRSIVTLGPPSNPKGYILKPTVRVVPKAITGSISGTITNPRHLPAAYAIAGTDTVTSTTVDENSGEFRLAFLPEGIYTVAIRDTLDLSFTKDGVEVVAGSNQDLGAITLQ
jgi:hypothetical protein